MRTPEDLQAAILAAGPHGFIEVSNEEMALLRNIPIQPKPRTMWAIGKWGAYEGQRPPLTFCETEENARGIEKLFRATCADQIYCVEVPIWPNVREEK